MSSIDWDGMEVILNGGSTEFMHFVGQETPDYMYEHWQNMHEAENQDYFVDVLNYSEEY